MDNTLSKLIRASRGPVLLMTLGVLLAVHQVTGMSFDQTFPILIIVFGMMWLLERMVPKRAADAVVNVASVPMAPLPPVEHDPLLYDPLRDLHRNVYGDVPRPASAPAPAPATVKPPVVDPRPVADAREVPTAEHPIRQQQKSPLLKDEDTLL